MEFTLILSVIRRIHRIHILVYIGIVLITISSFSCISSIKNRSNFTSWIMRFLLLSYNLIQFYLLLLPSFIDLVLFFNLHIAFIWFASTSRCQNNYQICYQKITRIQSFAKQWMNYSIKNLKTIKYLCNSS